ncbi:AMP-binding enzyme, partial [Massilia sp. TSP1-1-2]|uniref:AMP-binding enzyme n=1 Tax=Massilia sp. TSP1-1-2 TaxID=2804649 RepID=UPI003CF982A4
VSLHKKYWSEYKDSNLGPPGPKPGAVTAEKFVLSPFDSAQRLYKTGDLVRWLPDGNLEYLGRIDHQVKLRGFRIELGEIENALALCAGVKEVVVVAKASPAGDQRLVAYVATDSQEQELASQLRATLGASLPDYMVPSAFVLLAQLPLTPNGKVDRKALPAPDVSVQQRQYVAPQTQTEQALAAIWAEVLKVERVGIHDDFFELGGHSLLMIALVSKARSQGYQLIVKDFIAHARLSDMAAMLDLQPVQLAAGKVAGGSELVFSLPNKKMLAKNANEHHWNIALLLEVHDVDPAHLAHALKLIVEQNEGLRHCFVWGENAIHPS